ncbi:ribulose phosphate epimerase [Nannocystis bainbridge]|uniref:Ribulose phosphate epimerase n=1 Tax=Nannocystis bainbridge TaxID=2995303 RepID=A0ABT5ED31_9BACT|nr:ribulose phosphate epimerase [Nannocystis bainbridge]MDC0722686.1 ribulose phosphate epimerase [Nannocystis bainbridge]
MRKIESLKVLGIGALVGALLVVGCGDDKNGDTTADTITETGTPTGTESGTSTSTETGVPTGTETDTSTGTETETGTSTDTPTTSDTEGGAMCNPKVQDCPSGQKCVAFDSMAMNYWDANKCVEEPMNGGAVGDPCNINMGESVFSGLDNCSKGTICLNFDFATGQGGTCTAYCGEGNTCGDGELCLESANEGVLPVCLKSCDPLLQDCGDMQGCYGDPSFGGFICFAPDPGENIGDDNSPCEYTNACLAGFSCQAAETVEGCMGAMGCCTPYCSIADGDADCAPSEDCVAFFADPPPGTEDVGVCVIPS